MKALLTCLTLVHSIAFAQLGPHEQQGLEDTKKFLITPADRQKFVDKDPKAKEVDKKVESLAGTKENKEEIYGIAADIMEKITLETKGDPQAMQKLLQEAQKNPQAFYEKYFDANAKARVRGVATDIEKKNAVHSAPK